MVEGVRDVEDGRGCRGCSGCVGVFREEHKYVKEEWRGVQVCEMVICGAGDSI